MRHDHPTVHRDRGDGAHKLYRRGRNRALSDTDGNCLSGKPLLPEVAEFPLFGRHNSRSLLRQVDPSLLSQPQRGGIRGYPCNPDLLCQGIKEHITRLINRFRQIDLAVTGFHPAPEAAAIKLSSAIAVDVK